MLFGFSGGEGSQTLMRAAGGSAIPEETVRVDLASYSEVQKY